MKEDMTMFSNDTLEGHFSMPGDFARVAKEYVDTSHKLSSVVHTLVIFYLVKYQIVLADLTKKTLSKDEKTL
jgi:hypothetical protein